MAWGTGHETFVSDHSLPEREPRARFPWSRRRVALEAAEHRIWELEQKLERHRARRADLNRILSGLGEGVLGVDATGIVRYANPVAMQLLDVDPATCIGSHLFVAVPDTAVANAIEDVMRGDAHASPEERQRELVVEHDGIPRTLLIVVSPLRTEENADPEEGASFEGAIAVVRDVTDLRVLERTRQEFFTNVSHELKTPITAIRGALETVVGDDEVPPDVRDRFLANAQHHAHRLATLVNDLLSLARIERDPTSLPRAPVDLLTLVTEVLEGAEPMADRAGVTLEVLVQSVTEIEGDEEALRQAITNLVDNAVAHSPRDHTVTVTISDDGVIASVSVRDTGVGIPDEALERVFERFYRVDDARSRARGGTGIGLSIVKHVAQAHGGTVHVTSTLGAGSEFTLLLPVSRAPRIGTS